MKSQMIKVIFGYLVQFSWADTIWVHNQTEGSLGGREDCMFKLSRYYVRDSRTYMWTLIVGKFRLAWAKI